MFRVPLVTNDEDISLDQFWSAVLLFHDRPHLTNRRIIGASQLFFLKVKFSSSSIKKISDLFSYSALIYEIRKLKEISRTYVNSDLIKSILEPYDKKCELVESSTEEFRNCDSGTFVSVRILLPRQSTCKKNIEVVTFYKNENQNVATFFSVGERSEKSAGPPFPYDIEFVPPGVMNICVDKLEYAETSSADWLVSGLFPKLIKWSQESALKGDFKGSLCLVNMDLYCNLYHTLKEKYGKQMVKMWTERTDPSKYVYEDIAIVAYLIALWDRENPEYKPSFVDLGCGNGLLVHILNEEGYPGYGIDVRKRKIWDSYPHSTSLKVQTLIPSAESLFPEVDWIIGNHSDELTPWIPVITARSSHKTKFFLLPCCSYEFNGKKYKRKNTTKSQYADYIDYIKSVCEICGFKVAKDKLRIPSTKRICLVSQERTYSPKMFPGIDNKISELINGASNGDGKWVENFEARPETEKVRNCTKINKNVIESILKQISTELLSTEHFEDKPDGGKWNKGKKVLLPDLVKCVNQEDLKELKKECGGLQTLIKNHRGLFLIENGFVQFRIPPVFDENNEKHKSKTCWFHESHPDGCFYSEKGCSYKH